MKTRLIQTSLLILILFPAPINVHASIRELWKGKSDYSIDKFLAVDMNKNGTKEVLVLSGGKKIKLIEWDKNTFINKWQPPEFKTGVNFEYYDFTDSLWIKEFNPAYSQEYDRLSKCRKSLLLSFPPKFDKPEEYSKYDAFLKGLEKEKCGKTDSQIKPVFLHILLYKDGKYVLKKIEDSIMPFLKNEKYITSGSFQKKSVKDVIVTSEQAQEYYIYLRDTKPPYNLLWKSLFKIYKYEGVAIFGDFDNDKKIELLFIPYEEDKGYWISQVQNVYRVKEIKSFRKSLYKTTLPLFPLYSGNPEKYLKIGRTTSKDFDEVFFVEPAEVLYSGGLFKAIWNNDRFEFKDILYGLHGLDNLTVTDIDDDGLDEIIISDVRGDLVREEEEPYLENRRDVIHILKWDGKKYKKIWTSKSLGLITQIIVDDVTGDGKKEIIVGNDKGEIHIFGGK